MHRVLATAFPESEICPTRLWQDLEHVKPEDIRRFRLYSGHLTGSFADFLGKSLRTVTLLRDPVQRAISHYAHIRRDPSSPFYDLTQGLSLREFCLHPETRHLIEDYQARSLAGAALKAPPPWSKQIALRSSPEEQAAVLASARAAIRGCVAVGITEEMTETLANFAATLGLDWSGHTPYENASYNRPKSIDSDTLAVIRSITTLDALIYEEAAELHAESTRERLARPPSAVLAASPQRRGLLAQLSLPERSYRFKLRLSAAICRAPRFLRVALAWLYMAYRILVDQRVPIVSRIPLLLAGLYLVGPVDFAAPRGSLMGYFDEGLAIIVGVALSVSLAGKNVIQEMRLAATTRFDLGPYVEARPIEKRTRAFRPWRLL